MTLYVRIKHVGHFNTKECPSKEFCCTLNTQGKREGSTTKVMKTHKPDFSKEILKTKALESEQVSIIFICTHRRQPYRLALAYIPIKCLPQNKTAKVKLEFVGDVLRDGPIFHIDFHYDTKGSKPFSQKEEAANVKEINRVNDVLYNEIHGIKEQNTTLPKTSKRIFNPDNDSNGEPEFKQTKKSKHKQNYSTNDDEEIIMNGGFNSSNDNESDANSNSEVIDIKNFFTKEATMDFNEQTYDEKISSTTKKSKFYRDIPDPGIDVAPVRKTKSKQIVTTTQNQQTQDVANQESQEEMLITNEGAYQDVGHYLTQEGFPTEALTAPSVPFITNRTPARPFPNFISKFPPPPPLEYFVKLLPHLVNGIPPLEMISEDDKEIDLLHGLSTGIMKSEPNLLSSVQMPLQNSLISPQNTLGSSFSPENAKLNLPYNFPLGPSQNINLSSTTRSASASIFATAPTMDNVVPYSEINSGLSKYVPPSQPPSASILSTMATSSGQQVSTFIPGMDFISQDISQNISAAPTPMQNMPLMPTPELQSEPVSTPVFPPPISKDDYLDDRKPPIKKTTAKKQPIATKPKTLDEDPIGIVIKKAEPAKKKTTKGVDTERGQKRKKSVEGPRNKKQEVMEGSRVDRKKSVEPGKKSSTTKSTKTGPKKESKGGNSSGKVRNGGKGGTKRPTTKKSKK